MDREALIRRLEQVVGPQGVISERNQLRTYECDGLANFRVIPSVVVLPETADQVQGAVRACWEAGVPFVARGSGTGLSGGALPVSDGVLIVLARMRRVHEVDLDNQRAVVEPGVLNLQVTKEVAGDGFYYTPDPPGYDLLGAFVGSEGTLGITTTITLRLLRKPEAVRTLLAAFEGTDHAGDAVSKIIGAGIVPAAIEMMDALAMEAAEAAVHVHYPEGAGAVLVVELDGPEAEVAHQFDEVERLCREAGSTTIQIAEDDDQRALFWKGRKSAFAAVGRISPDYYVQDGVIPRTALPEVLRRITELADERGLRVANVFHAGDGNLHPLVLYDGEVEGQEQRAEELAAEILLTCLEHGGSITGEHGVGFDKKQYLPKQFSAEDLDTMQLVRCAFDPDGRSNPGKVFPTPRLCGERPGPRRVHPAEQAGLAEVF